MKTMFFHLSFFKKNIILFLKIVKEEGGLNLCLLLVEVKFRLNYSFGPLTYFLVSFRSLNY